MKLVMKKYIVGRLREIRKDYGLTVREVSEYTGIPEHQFWNWELNHRPNPPLEALLKWAEVLNHKITPDGRVIPDDQ